MNPGLLAAALWTLDHLMNLRVPGEPRISPDGRTCAYTLGGAVYVQPAAGGLARRVASGSRPRWSADSKTLAFLDDGKIQRIAGAPVAAPGPINAFEWLPGGGGFAAIAGDARPAPDPIVAGQDDRNARLWWLPAAGTAAKPRAMSPADRHVISFAVSPDGKRAVYAAQPSSGSRYAFQADLFEVDFTTGAWKALVTQPGRDAEPSFSPDGSLVAFHSQAGSANYFEARHVALVRASGGEIRYVTANSSLDVFRGGNVFAWSPDSRQLYFTAGRGVVDVLAGVELATGKETVVAERITGAASFSASGEAIAYLDTSPVRPPELCILERGKMRRLTATDSAVAALPRPKSEVVRWKSKDGLEVEGVLWLPPDYMPGRRIPLLTELHGGPTGAALHSFPMPRTYPTQLFLDRGIGVFAPNFRGSSNYGAAFRLRNSLSQGMGDYEDVMSGLDRLVERGIADPDRLGVMGWSYGGYLTGSAIAQTHQFKAASIGAPATDWTTYYGQADGPREIFHSYFGGLPWEVPRNYERHSYRDKLGEVRTPTLLQVGSVDINHNGEIYQALSDRNVPVEYVVYPREGHAIREPAHVRDLMERNFRWFVRWLGVMP